MASHRRCFFYSYKTGNGTRWYIVEPAKGTKSLLFDHDRLAAQLTEIVNDPFIGSALPIRNLEPQGDGKTFTFEVVSSQEAKPDTTSTAKKPKRGEKEIFYFSYHYPTKTLTHLKRQKKR